MGPFNEFPARLGSFEFNCRLNLEVRSDNQQFNNRQFCISLENLYNNPW
jgi:hypothetical protein